MPSSSSALAACRHWLQQLLQTHASPWRWDRSLRAAISVGLPFLVGLWCDDIMTGMWVAMGALMQATGEAAGSYRQRFLALGIAAPLGALGYFAGYLDAQPWWVTVLAMSIVGLIAGRLSRISVALSIGCLQGLLVASIAIGVPAIAPFWQPALLYLAGALWYALLLALEALCWPHRPQHEALVQLCQRLAAYARQGAAPGATRYALLSDLQTLPHGALRDSTAALFVQLTASDTPAVCAAMAQSFDQLEAALCDGSRQPAPAPALPPALAHAYQAFTAALHAARHASPAAPPPRPSTPHAWRTAWALALCLGVAYAMHWIDDTSHWFWVPLTVGLIMKPDFGSVVARAVLRSIGTVGGVILGALILTLVPKGLVFILIMTALTGLLPWAMQRSYAWQAVFLTPLILMLVDIILPGSRNVDFAAQRLLDTLIGAAIIVVFGYLIWPQHRQAALLTPLQTFRQRAADYLLASLNGAPDPLNVQGQQAYLALAALHAAVQPAQEDSPGAARERLRWRPCLEAAEHICDAITRYAAAPAPQPDPHTTRELARLAAALAQGDVAAAPHTLHQDSDTPAARLATALQQHLRSLAPPGVL